MNPLTLKRVALLTAIACSPAAAGMISFTSRVDFNSAVGATTVETFGSTYYLGLSGPISSTHSTTALLGGTLPAGVLLPGATYSTTSYTGGSWPFNIDDGGSFASKFLDSMPNGSDLRPLTVTFDDPVAAIAFDADLLNMTSFDLTFHLVGGGSEEISATLAPSPWVQFFGYQSSTSDIESITLQGSGSRGFAIDNFTFGGEGSGPAVPEPATWGALALGLAALATKAGRRCH